MSPDDSTIRPSDSGDRLDTESGLEPCLMAQRKISIRYSDDIADQITNKLQQGFSIYTILAEEGMPTQATYAKWRSSIPEFRKRLDAARETCAHFAEEKIKDLAEQAPSMGKDDVHGPRLAVDTLKYIAEVNDPARYGKKTTIQGDVARPIVFRVISRIPDVEVPKEVTSTVIEVLTHQAAVEEDPDDAA